jgi:hypothetical protein
MIHDLKNLTQTLTGFCADHCGNYVTTNPNFGLKDKIAKAAKSKSLKALNNKFNATEEFKKSFGAFYFAPTEQTLHILDIVGRADTKQKWTGSKFIQTDIDYSKDVTPLGYSYSFEYSSQGDTELKFAIRRNNSNHILYFNEYGDFVHNGFGAQNVISQKDMFERYKQSVRKFYGDNFRFADGILYTDEYNIQIQYVGDNGTLVEYDYENKKYIYNKDTAQFFHIKKDEIKNFDVTKYPNASTGRCGAMLTMLHDKVTKKGINGLTTTQLYMPYGMWEEPENTVEITFDDVWDMFMKNMPKNILELINKIF